MLIYDLLDGKINIEELKAKIIAKDHEMINCLECNKLVIKSNDDKKYCSTTCRNRAKRRRLKDEKYK